MPNKKRNVVSYKRNEPAWGFDRLRSDALSRLLDDLYIAEQEGIPDEVCKQVRLILNRVVNLATEFPDKSTFRASIFSVMQNFEEQYGQWNDIDGNSNEHKALRAKKLKDLRKTRHILSTVTRKNIHIVQENLDLTLIRCL